MAVRVVNSTIIHHLNGMNCSSTVKLEKRTVPEYYIRTLIYQNLYEWQFITEYFGEGALLVELDVFQICMCTSQSKWMTLKEIF